MDHEAFRTFLKSEIARRNLSVREFASLVKVSHTTIQRFTDDAPARQYVPTLDFLAKLAAGTGVSLNTLLSICFPLVARPPGGDPDIDLIIDGILRLSPEARQMVLKFVRSIQE